MPSQSELAIADFHLRTLIDTYYLDVMIYLDAYPNSTNHLCRVLAPQGVEAISPLEAIDVMHAEVAEIWRLYDMLFADKGNRYKSVAHVAILGGAQAMRLIIESHIARAENLLRETYIQHTLDQLG